MAEKSDTLKTGRERETDADRSADREKAREALRRLRRLGENLPAVDAAAIVREGRDLSEHGAR